MIVYKNINTLYKAIGNIDSAYSYYSRYSKLSEIISDKNKFKEFAELKEKYETEKKDQQIKLQNEEIRKNELYSYWLISALVLSLIIALLIGYNYLQKKRTNSILSEQKQKIVEANISLEQANKTKDKLFSIIAHDLRAPIASLKRTLESSGIDEKETIIPSSITKQITLSINTLHNLTDNLLNWALAERNKNPFQSQ